GRARPAASERSAGAVGQRRARARRARVGSAAHACTDVRRPAALGASPGRGSVRKSRPGGWARRGIPTVRKGLRSEGRFTANGDAEGRRQWDDRSHEGRSMHALIVDDDATSVMVLSRMLADRGFTTRVAGSLADARDSLDPSPDVCVVELELPDGEGT